MNAEQLEHLYYETGDFDEMCAAKAQAVADIAAMLTPITAEALTAAGWKFEAHEDAYAKHTATHDIFVELQGDNPPVVEVEWTCQGETHQMPVGHAENMYDLRELVRLLGGKA